MIKLVRIGLLAAVLGLAACGGDGDAASTTTNDDTGANSTTTLADSSSTTNSPESDGEEGRVAQDGDSVAVDYTGTLDDGEEFDSSVGRQPLTFVIGSGQVIPGFDDAVRGLAVGESRTVRIEPGDAYGEISDELILEFPIENAPEGIAVGDQVQLGNGAPAVVIEVTESTVTVDANHPLAGQALTFTVTLVSIG